MAATKVLTRADEMTDWVDSHNRIVDRDKGNFGDNVVWRYDGSAYQLDSDNPSGNHANFGTGVLTIQDAAVTAGVVVRVTDGDQANPSITFSNDQNTGLYRATTDTGGLTAGGTLVAEWAKGGATALQFLLSGSSVVGTPALASFDDADTGLYWVSANRFAAAAGGIKVAEFANPSGSLYGVGIGRQPSYMLDVYGTRTGDWAAAVIQNGSASGDKGMFVSTADTHAATPVFQAVYNITTIGLSVWADGGVSIGNAGASQGAGTLQLTSSLYLTATTTLPLRRSAQGTVTSGTTVNLSPNVTAGVLWIRNSSGYVAGYGLEGGNTRLGWGDTAQWAGGTSASAGTVTTVYITASTLTLKNNTAGSLTYDLLFWG